MAGHTADARASFKCGKQPLRDVHKDVMPKGIEKRDRFGRGLRPQGGGGLFARCKPCGELLPTRERVCNLAFSRQ